MIVEALEVLTMTPRVKPEESPEEQFQNGKITLRDYMETCIRNMNNYLEARLVAERQYMEAIVSRDVTRLEGNISAGIAQIQVNAVASEKAALLSEANVTSRLESHNQFRQQIEKERAELVRRDDLIRVEKEMAMRFEVVSDKVVVAAENMEKTAGTIAAATEKTLTGFERRLSNMEGRWLASTVLGGLLISAVGLAVVLVGLLNV